jgi:hypothetical protein
MQVVVFGSAAESRDKKSRPFLWGMLRNRVNHIPCYMLFSNTVHWDSFLLISPPERTDKFYFYLEDLIKELKSMDYQFKRLTEFYTPNQGREP